MPAEPHENVMQLNTIQDIIEDIRSGKPVILMDDEDRENEGDLIVSAEKVTPEIVNFMVREARGLLCLALSGERCDYLRLSSMVATGNNDSYGTPFTVSIEAAKGVTTGISAHDRAHTLRVAIDRQSKPEDITQPGHIFPLRAQSGGVLSRAGHTEAGCDLTRLAGLRQGAAIIEIMNEDGSMSRRPELERFSEKHGLKIGTINDLIHYRINHEKIVSRQEQKTIDTEFGQFDMTVYQDKATGSRHAALSKGHIRPDSSCTVRIHKIEAFRDLLGVRHTTNNHTWSLRQAMQVIGHQKKGVIVLLESDAFAGLSATLGQSIQEQEDVTSSCSSFYKYRLGIASQILKDLGVRQMHLLGSPRYLTLLSKFGLNVLDCISGHASN